MTRSTPASWPNCCAAACFPPFTMPAERAYVTLQELARSYRALTKDTTRVMSRLKAVYRGWGIACGGQQVYAPRYREAWLKQLREAGVRRRAEQLYEQFDFLRALHRRVRRELLVESVGNILPVSGS